MFMYTRPWQLCNFHFFSEKWYSKFFFSHVSIVIAHDYMFADQRQKQWHVQNWREGYDKIFLQNPTGEAICVEPSCNMGHET